MTLDARAEQLIHACLNQATTPDEQTELNRLIESDPEAAKAFAHISRLDGMLRASFGDLTASLRQHTSAIRADAAAGHAHRSRRGRSLPRRRFRASSLVWLAAAAATVALAAVMLVDEQPGPVEEVALLEDVAGEVTIIADARRAPAGLGDGLLPGQGIETSPGARAVMRFGDDTRVQLQERTLISSIAVAAGKKLAVARGSLTAEVAKQPPGRPMVLTTPHGVARVVGTRFGLTVTAGPDGSTRVEVDEGTVRVTSDAGATADVGAGQRALLARGVLSVKRTGAEDVDLDRGLVAHWKLDEGAGTSVRDASGGEHHGVVNGATWTTGRVGGALLFDGVDDFVTMGDAVDVAGPLTVAAWVNGTFPESPQPHSVLTKFWEGVSSSYYLVVYRGKLRGSVVASGGAAKFSNSRTAVAENTWVHLAMTWSGEATEAVRVFVNGREDTRHPVELNEAIPRMGDSSAELMLGARRRPSNALEATFVGKIDDARVYDRPLGVAEIEALAGASSGWDDTR